MADQERAAGDQAAAAQVGQRDCCVAAVQGHHAQVGGRVARCYGGVAALRPAALVWLAILGTDMLQLYLLPPTDAAP